MSDMGKTVLTYFGIGRRAVPGEVGIEIEVEGANLIPGFVEGPWVVHQDGSLRGESAEYVLGRPIPRDQVEGALEFLKWALEKSASVLNFSHRTSVHVHLNVQNWRMVDVYNLVCLYLLYEDILIRFSGPERESNLFCLRFKDAEALLAALVQGLETGRLFRDFDENNRYSSLNLCALRKFGSVEFRSMRGNLEVPFITQWVNILTRLADSARTFKNPREIIVQFSALGPEGFFRETALPGLEYTEGDYLGMYEGMRLAQELAYASDWVIPKPRARTKPPARDAREIPVEIEDRAEQGVADGPRIQWVDEVLDAIDD